MTAIQEAIKLKGEYKKDYKKLMKETWAGRIIQGKFQYYLGNEYIDVKQSF